MPPWEDEGERSGKPQPAQLRTPHRGGIDRVVIVSRYDAVAGLVTSLATVQPVQLAT